MKRYFLFDRAFFFRRQLFVVLILIKLRIACCLTFVFLCSILIENELFKSIQKNGENIMKKELKRMSRSELLEILIFQVEENERLKAELDECKTLLERRNIAVSETGTLAEAAIRINEVFEAADAAAKQYLENIGANTADYDPVGMPTSFGSSSAAVVDAKRQAEEIIADARARADKITGEAELFWQETLKKARILLKNK